MKAFKNYLGDYLIPFLMVSLGLICLLILNIGKSYGYWDSTQTQFNPTIEEPIVKIIEHREDGVIYKIFIFEKEFQVINHSREVMQTMELYKRIPVD